MVSAVPHINFPCNRISFNNEIGEMEQQYQYLYCLIDVTLISENRPNFHFDFLLHHNIL